MVQTQIVSQRSLAQNSFMAVHNISDFLKHFWSIIGNNLFQNFESPVENNYTKVLCD